MSETRALRIEGEMTIYRAGELAQLLESAAAALPAGAPLELDLSGVTEMDCAGVQLLLASARTAAACGRTLRLALRSDAVDEVFATLHLHAHFAEAVAA
jgi:anti-anti-sigma factor